MSVDQPIHVNRAVDVRAGDPVVVGTHGIRAVPLGRDRASRAFQFMGSAVSSEKPKRLIIARVARLLREKRAEGKKIVAVLGPAVVHTGAAPAFAKLVAGGWIEPGTFATLLPQEETTPRQSSDSRWHWPDSRP